MTKSIRLMIIMSTMWIVASCNTIVAKPVKLPYDYALDKKIESQKKDMLSNRDIAKTLVNTQLNDYETLRQKTKTVILKNNKLSEK